MGSRVMEWREYSELDGWANKLIANRQDGQLMLG